MVGGGRGSPRKFAGAPYSISTVRQLLRQRCDARGFTPLPIEIIARRKAAPAFEPQKVSRRTAPPPPPDAAWWGGSRLTEKICRGPIFHFNRQTIVATALRCARFHAAAN